MADEIRLTASLQIRKDFLDYRSTPNSFKADMSVAKGPSPGAIRVDTDGTDVNLSELAQPGMCFIQNLDATNFVMVGIWEPDTSLFYPLFDINPGEFMIGRISRWLGEQYQNTGTGTGTSNQTLRIKADTADCVVRVDVFDT